MEDSPNLSHKGSNFKVVRKRDEFTAGNKKGNESTYVPVSYLNEIHANFVIPHQ